MVSLPVDRVKSDPSRILQVGLDQYLSILFGIQSGHFDRLGLAVREVDVATDPVNCQALRRLDVLQNDRKVAAIEAHSIDPLAAHVAPVDVLLMTVIG